MARLLFVFLFLTSCSLAETSSEKKQLAIGHNPVGSAILRTLNSPVKVTRLIGAEQTTETIRIDSVLGRELYGFVDTTLLHRLSESGQEVTNTMGDKKARLVKEGANLTYLLLNETNQGFFELKNTSSFTIGQDGRLIRFQLQGERKMLFGEPFVYSTEIEVL